MGISSFGDTLRYTDCEWKIVVNTDTYSQVIVFSIPVIIQ